MRDLTDLTFGWLYVMHLVGSKGSSNVYWHCRCRCGQEKDVRQDVLVSGRVVSCGCRKSDEQVSRSRVMQIPKAARIKKAKTAAKARWNKQ